jgi:hypothetical protein
MPQKASQLPGKADGRALARPLGAAVEVEAGTEGAHVAVVRVAVEHRERLPGPEADVRGGELPAGRLTAAADLLAKCCANLLCMWCDD